jgi:membrane-bound metal-dependent hydrolase YbcI (DUF457 family)
MTTPEHTLVGVLGAMSLGLHTRLGWTAIAFAAVVSNVPDLDGLPMLLDMERFEAGHRVWGHNLLAIMMTTIFAAFLQFRFRWIEWFATRITPLVPSDARIQNPSSHLQPGFTSLLLIGLVFQSTHLLCDITVSGGQGLSDWHVKPFWPFNETAYVFPLIPWGDIGPTIIMMLGAIGIAKLGNAKRLSIVALCVVCLYMLGRGYARGAFTAFEA